MTRTIDARTNFKCRSKKVLLLSSAARFEVHRYDLMELHNVKPQLSRAARYEWPLNHQVTRQECEFMVLGICHILSVKASLCSVTLTARLL